MLVTPPPRNSCRSDGVSFNYSFTSYANAMKELGQTNNVAVVDLGARAVTYLNGKAIATGRARTSSSSALMAPSTARTSKRPARTSSPAWSSRESVPLTPAPRRLRQIAGMSRGFGGSMSGSSKNCEVYFRVVTSRRWSDDVPPPRPAVPARRRAGCRRRLQRQDRRPRRRPVVPAGRSCPTRRETFPTPRPPPVAAALPARAWRLTHAEYRKSVKDVTGVDVDTSAVRAGGRRRPVRQPVQHQLRPRQPRHELSGRRRAGRGHDDRRAAARAGADLHDASGRVQGRLHPRRADARLPAAAQRRRDRGDRLGVRRHRRHRHRRRDVPVPRRGAGGADVAVLPVPHRDRRRRERGAAELPHHRPRGGVVPFVQRARPGDRPRRCSRPPTGAS